MKCCLTSIGFEKKVYILGKIIHCKASDEMLQSRKKFIKDG